jgi:hypothetical protein
MCGSVHHNDVTIKVGIPVDVYNPENNKLGRAIWSGHIRSDKCDFWIKQSDCVPVKLVVSAFTEGKYTFVIPSGYWMNAYGLRKDVHVNERLVGPAKSVKIETREARTDFEKSVHHRWPVVTKIGSSELYLFTEKDVKHVK